MRQLTLNDYLEPAERLPEIYQGLRPKDIHWQTWRATVENELMHDEAIPASPQKTIPESGNYYRCVCGGVLCPVPSFIDRWEWVCHKNPEHWARVILRTKLEFRINGGLTGYDTIKVDASEGNPYNPTLLSKDLILSCLNAKPGATVPEIQDELYKKFPWAKKQSPRPFSRGSLARAMENLLKAGLIERDGEIQPYQYYLPGQER